MKKRKILLVISILLNVFLITLVTILAFWFRGELRQKFSPHVKTNIVMLGTSLTSGGRWNLELKRKDIVNSGFGGSTSAHFLWEIKKNVLDYKPKICFIEGGTNDVLIGVPLYRTFINYKILLDTLIKNNIEPVLTGTFFLRLPNDAEMNSRIDSLDKFMKETAAHRHLEYIDLNKDISENNRLKEEYSGDGVHIKRKAYKFWLAEVEKILSKKGI